MQSSLGCDSMPTAKHHYFMHCKMHWTVTRTKILAGTFRGKIFYTHLKPNSTNTYSTKLHTSYILYQETITSSLSLGMIGHHSCSLIIHSTYF